MTTATELAAATLACLPNITPARLRALIEHFGDPERALDAVRSGRALEAPLADPNGVGVTRRMREHVSTWPGHADPAVVARLVERRGTRVFVDSGDEYPISDTVPDRPAVLLAEGVRADALALPRVAVVGTRGASPHGLADARELGAFLAGAGVTVVSGMAIGIDGAAHEGALGAGGLTVGVVATG